MSLRVQDGSEMSFWNKINNVLKRSCIGEEISPQHLIKLPPWKCYKTIGLWVSCAFTIGSWPMNQLLSNGWRMVNPRLSETARLIYFLRARDFFSLANETTLRKKSRLRDRWNLKESLRDSYFLKNHSLWRVTHVRRGGIYFNRVPWINTIFSFEFLPLIRKMG